jgi:formylmethanofuran dehydrogenase subunit D
MRVLMNTGRSIRQGSYVERKNSQAYYDEASACRMHPVDMMDLGVEPGEHVRATGPAGSVVLHVLPADGVQRGEVFVTLGPYANHLVDAETRGTGMPDFKSTSIDLEPTGEDITTVAMLMEACGGVQYRGRDLE